MKFDLSENTCVDPSLIVGVNMGTDPPVGWYVKVFCQHSPSAIVEYYETQDRCQAKYAEIRKIITNRQALRQTHGPDPLVPMIYDTLWST